MSDEQEKNVNGTVDLIDERVKVRLSKARTMVHKYVREGKCKRYRTKDEETDFKRPGLSKNQKRQIEKAIKEVMRDLETEEAKVRIHEILVRVSPDYRNVVYYAVN